MTAELVSNLHAAIDNAREPGGRRYAAPCLIGALARLHGEYWSKMDQSGVVPRGYTPNVRAVLLLQPKSALHAYPLPLLQELQRRWDNAFLVEGAFDLQRLRDRLHLFVQSGGAVEP